MDPAPLPHPGAAPRAPFGRRSCAVTANRGSGGYRVFSLLDREGPEPAAGQFYMLASAERWTARGGRAYLPRAISVAETGPAGRRRLDFLVDDVGPGTERLCQLEQGEEVWVTGPLGNAFGEPTEVPATGPPERSWSAAGLGSRRWRWLRRRFSERAVRTGSCSASATRSTAVARPLLLGRRRALPRGAAGQRGRARRPPRPNVPDLLGRAGPASPLRRLSYARAAADARGGPLALRRRVRPRCARHGARTLFGFACRA